MLMWTFCVVFLIFVYVRLVKPHFYWKEREVVHKKPWPIFGDFLEITFQRISFSDYVEKVYNEINTRYLGMYQFLEPVLVIKDPELVKQMTVKDFDSFLDHRTFIDENIDPLFGKNIFSLKGQKWRQMRSVLSPAFTGSKMRAMFVLMLECAEQYADYLLEESELYKIVELEMKDTFTRFANDVIATCSFGFKCDSMKEKDNEFYKMGFKATDFSGLKGLKFTIYGFSPMLAKFLRIKIFDDDVSEFFRRIVKDTIGLREKEGIARPDMIHLLMEAKKGLLKHEDGKKDEDAGFATVEESQLGKQNQYGSEELTDDDITAQALLFFLAGFDTITGAMCHLAHELAINPDVQHRLQIEIDQTFEENHGKLSYDSLLSMKYLDMVISEGLRKWPSAIISDRICTKPYTIHPVNPNEKPVRLVPGNIIWIPTFGIHRDPLNYPDPERFDPERFSDDNKKNIKPMTYIPFGTGPRNCIGSRFALMEIKIMFVTFLRRFNIVVTKKTQIPLKLSKHNFNLNAENGFWLGFEPRDISIIKHD